MKVELERAQRQDPPAVQFLQDKQLAREALHILVHLEARVEEEDRLRRERGYGDVNDGSWGVMQSHVAELELALCNLKSAMTLMLDEETDIIDAEPIDDWDEHELEAMAELEAEIVVYDTEVE